MPFNTNCSIPLNIRWHTNNLNDCRVRIFFVGKNGMPLFFLFCFNFFFHFNSLGKYERNIFVGKIRRLFTNENISSIFLFIFIDFLVVSICASMYINKIYYHISYLNRWIVVWEHFYCWKPKRFVYLISPLRRTNTILIKNQVGLFS